MTEVGVQWVFTRTLGSLAGTKREEGVRTFLCLSLCLPNCSSGALKQTKPHSSLFVQSTGPGQLSINIPLVGKEGRGTPGPG